MPTFIKILFGSCLGTLLALGVLFFVGVSVVGGLAASADEKPSVAANSILHLDLSAVPELTNNAEPEVDPFSLNFPTDDILGVHDIVRAIERAAEDDNIKGIYLNSMMTPVSFTKLRTIREALLEFKESDKFVVSFAPVYEQSSYYLASAGDEVYLGPLGVVDFRGLGSEIPFLKNGLDRLGVKMEVFYAGDYKSATEPFRRTEISEANREQTKIFLEDLFGVMLEDIATARGLPKEELRRYADEMTGWKEQEAVDAGLVDGILRRTEIDEKLHEKLGLDPEDDINSIKVEKYFAARLKRLKGGGDREVAVVIAEGTIIDGEGDLGSIGDKKYVNTIEKVTEDEDVKAVVLRVNSGGGSASSSENIWYAVEQLKAAGKPVVVSMGDYAASGGYYIAAGADRIYAEPTTITGSIGVFLTFPIVEEMFDEKLGIRFDTVNTAANANAFSPFRQLGGDERALLTSRTKSIYQTFLSRVAAGRDLPLETVEKIAGGRVYSGLAAKENGLIDEFGGLEEAIAHAAELASLEEDDFSVGQYPKMKPVWEQFLEEFLGEGNGITSTEVMIRRKLGPEAYEMYRLMNDMTQASGPQARLPLVVKF